MKFSCDPTNACIGRSAPTWMKPVFRFFLCRRSTTLPLTTKLVGITFFAVLLLGFFLTFEHNLDVGASNFVEGLRTLTSELGPLFLVKYGERKEVVTNAI
mgnify:CR=1 FL=1